MLSIEDWATGEVAARVVLDRVRRCVQLVVWDQSRRPGLEELFDGHPLVCFTAGFQTPDGVCGDAVERIDLWDPRAVRCLDEKLYMMGLRLARATRSPGPPSGGADAVGCAPA